jgi:hypothetical protein
LAPSQGGAVSGTATLVEMRTAGLTIKAMTTRFLFEAALTENPANIMLSGQIDLLING